VEVALVPFASLLAALADVPDPRRPQGQRYSMRHLLLFSVLATLAGATSYQKIIAFIVHQRARLNAVFGAVFPRAPVVNTLRHLFLALDGGELEAAFRRHACDLNVRGTPEVLRTVALDGKTLRGSVEPRGSPDFDHLTDRKAVHVLSAFASDAALILAHQELAGAPDEIAAVPKLMAELGVTGVLFTADALHCQKDGFAQAAATGNALLVRVKDNQSTLHATLAGLCAEQHSYDSHETVDRRRHGRQEHRRVEVFDTAGQLNEPWQTLISCVARVTRLTYIKDTRSGLWPTREEVGYYPCQTRHGAKVLGCAIRAHWGTENRAHYVRDVTLGEDASRIRTRPGVMARIRSVALNILRANGVQNISQALYNNALSLDMLLTLGTS
jgi:predicted transposase YbfD/YdcC